MRKLLYITLLLIFGLSACTNNSDEPVAPPAPPPIVSQKVTIDSLLGTWETFYYMKYVTVNPGTPYEASYGNLRLIDYDGFKTKFWEENGVYKFKSMNVYGIVAGREGEDKEGVFRLSENSDSIIFTWFKNGKDTTTAQKVQEFYAYPGVMQNEAVYTGTTEDGSSTKYRVSDLKKSRKIEIAPNATGGVNPAKEKIDFQELHGEWEIYISYVFYDMRLDQNLTAIRSKALLGAIYKFYTTDQGIKKLDIRQKMDNGVWGTEYYDIHVVDDIMYYKGKDPETGKDKIIWLWVTDRKIRNGKDSFIDKYENRYDKNIKVIYRTESYFRRL